MSWDRDSGRVPWGASKWPILLATAPVLPSTSSIEEGHAPAQGQIKDVRIRRAFFTKERMLSQAEYERRVTCDTKSAKRNAGLMRRAKLDWSLDSGIWQNRCQ